MNGLEEIVLTIKNKAEAQSKEIIKNAEEKARKIADDAEKSAQAEYDKIMAETSRKVERIHEAARSASVSNGLKQTLKFKSETVADVISETLGGLASLSVDEYFEIIEKLIYANFHKNENGELFLSESDKNRMPEGFAEKINKTLKADNAQLTFGGTADIENGFVLCYGDIEENCSFNAIVSSKEDELKDEIASILFN